MRCTRLNLKWNHRFHFKFAAKAVCAHIKERSLLKLLALVV